MVKNILKMHRFIAGDEIQSGAFLTAQILSPLYMAFNCLDHVCKSC